MASLAPFAGAAFKAARKQGRREAQEAYAFDGLVALAGAGGGHKPRYDISVRVDLEALLRGYPLGGELCELVGYGTISAQAACDMVASGNGLLRAVVTKGRYVTGVAHPGRRATSHVATALDFVFPRCAAQGCGVRAGYLQTDHRIDWSKTRTTMFDLLDRLCPRHHAMKTNLGWALAPGTGKRPFVAPGDPRHPANCAPAAALPQLPAAALPRPLATAAGPAAGPADTTAGPAAGPAAAAFAEIGEAPLAGRPVPAPGAPRPQGGPRPRGAAAPRAKPGARAKPPGRASPNGRLGPTGQEGAAEHAGQPGLPGMGPT